MDSTDNERAQNSIPIIEIPALSARARGRVYGEEAKEAIHKILDAYRSILSTQSTTKWSESTAAIAPYVKCTQEKFPELIEEIKGIAEGAGVAFSDIFVLNCRSEILFRNNNIDECTSLAKKYGTEYKCQTLIAQNWDWYETVLDCQVILKLSEHNDIPSIVTFTEAGQLAKIGMNSAGLGLVVNNLNPNLYQVGIPWIMIARKILECNSFTQALGTIFNNIKGHSINYLLAQTGGLIADVETSPKKDEILWPEEGCIAHTNHYLGSNPDIKDLKFSEDPFPSTFVRWWTADSKLKSTGELLDINSIKAILTDHSDYPFSICWHRNKKLDTSQQPVTCLSLIMEIEKGVLYYTKGNPCRHTYNKLDFSSFLQRIQKEEKIN